MTMRAFFTSLWLAVPLVAAAMAPSGKATLRNAKGERVGTATFTQTKDGVRISVEAAGLPPGDHGIHVHATGKCEPPDFKSAGSHLNPSGRKHGLENPEGAHAGDLPNISVSKDGRARATFTAKGVTLGEGAASLFGPSGAALVVHADPDDGKSDPAGNSGARIVCGVIEKG